jgi:hypothetical protein
MMAEGDLVEYEGEDVILTRIYIGWKWAKIEKFSGEAVWVHFNDLTEKEK